MAHLLETKEITVRVNPEIAKALKSGEFVSLNDIEDWTKKDVIVGHIVVVPTASTRPASRIRFQASGRTE